MMRLLRPEPPFVPSGVRERSSLNFAGDQRSHRRAPVGGLVVALLAGAAFAQAPARFAVVGSAQLDGKPDEAAALEALLGQVLVKKGQRLVDAAVATKVRALVTAEDAAAGKLPKGLTSLEADWVLGATATCKTISKQISPQPNSPPSTIIAANCDVTLALTRIDTGDVAGKASLFGKAPSASARESVRRALESVAAQFESQHADTFIAAASAHRPIALWLFGAEDRATADAVRAAVGALPGASNPTLLDFSTELSKLEVTFDGGGLELAKAIDQANLPVAIERASGGRLSLRRDPARAFRTRFTVGAVGGDKALALQSAVVPARLAALLLGSPYLVRAPDGSADALVISATVTKGKKGEATCALTATRPNEKRPVATSSGQGADPLLEALKLLETALPGKLAALAPVKGQPSLAALPAAVEQSKKLRALEVVRFEAPDLLPARSARYAGDLEVATIWVQSRTGRPIEGITANAELEGFSVGPRLEESIGIGPNAPVRMPLKIAFDEKRLLAQSQATIAQLRVEVQWLQNGAERAQQFVIPVRVLERGAIDWKETALAAAFVNPRDEAVKTLAASALHTGGDAAGLPANVVRAIRVIEALGVAGLKYAPDPVTPFGKGTIDFVNFPGETLTRKTGDCDDFAVLAASMLEAAGVPTRLVTTPGHILVAFDAGVAPLHATFADFARGEAFAIEGHTFIPLEATALGGGYRHAWEEGSKEVVRHRDGQLDSVSVREAWKQYPPSGGVGSTPAAPVDGLDATVGKALAALAAANQTALQARLTSLDARLATTPGDPGLLNERAFILVSAGRLDEALTTARPGADKDLALKLTVANVLALKGELKDAEQLLSGAPPAPKEAAAAYLFNVAIFRFLAGNDQRAAESLASALALDPLAAAAMSDDGSEGRGDEKSPPVVLKADLAALLKRARERTAKQLTAPTQVAEPRNSASVAGRRGADPGSRVLVAQTLRWLVVAKAP